VDVPVFALRFTHDTIDSRLHFQNQKSIYKLFDDLQRGVKEPKDVDEPLDIVVRDGKVWSLSNRRLMTLRMYQSLHLDQAVYAPCIARGEDWKGGKFFAAKTTKNDGLGIDAGSASSASLHGLRPLFNPGRASWELLRELLTGTGHEYMLNVFRLRQSKRGGTDAESLTLLSAGSDARAADEESVPAVDDAPPAGQAASQGGLTPAAQRDPDIPVMRAVVGRCRWEGQINEAQNYSARGSIRFKPVRPFYPRPGHLSHGNYLRVGPELPEIELIMFSSSGWSFGVSMGEDGWFPTSLCANPVLHAKCDMENEHRPFYIREGMPILIENLDDGNCLGCLLGGRTKGEMGRKMQIPIRMLESVDAHSDARLRMNVPAPVPEPSSICQLHPDSDECSFVYPAFRCIHCGDKRHRSENCLQPWTPGTVAYSTIFGSSSAAGLGEKGLLGRQLLLHGVPLEDHERAKRSFELKSKHARMNGRALPVLDLSLAPDGFGIPREGCRCGWCKQAFPREASIVVSLLLQK